MEVRHRRRKSILSWVVAGKPHDESDALERQGGDRISVFRMAISVRLVRLANELCGSTRTPDATEKKNWRRAIRVAASTGAAVAAAHLAIRRLKGNGSVHATV